MLTFNVQPVKAAAAAVYIMADGSVDPSTAPIQRNESTYTLTDNITSDYDGIWIEKDNVILDGAGYTLQSTGAHPMSDGIYLLKRNNVTIRNTEIKQFYIGIDISESSNNNIYGNTITGNSEYGFWMTSSSNNNIKNNIIGNNYDNFYISSSSNNTISENKITNGRNGIWIIYSSYHSIVENSITGNNASGVWLYGSKYNRISGNYIANNWRGIGVGSSSYNRISGNNITTNDSFGIDISGSSYNSIIGNNIIGNNGWENGIWLSSSLDNTICGNNIANNRWGISLDSSSNNVLYHNSFVNNVQQFYTYNSMNTWDDDYPSGGNYWSDYTGEDSNNDGIGDAPYIIGGDIDRYPHMKAWTSTVYLYPSSVMTEVGRTFNVSIVACLSQNLWAWQAGIKWDPTILEYVSYTWGEFQAFAEASKSSPPTIDNAAGKTSRPALESALRGWLAPISVPEVKLLTITVKVVKAGTSKLRLVDVSLKDQNSTSTTAYPRWSDVNSDGVIDAKDVEPAYKSWEGSYYNQTADFNDDDIVDVADISIVTSDFGKNNTDPGWGVTNTIHDIPVAVVSAYVDAKLSEAYISVPYYSQLKGYYCGPAALEMVFDFYGPDVSQLEIADASRTSPQGAFTFDMVRAAHFSDVSTSIGKESQLNYTGYTARELGYAAFERSGLTIDDLKSLIVAGYPIIVLTTWHFRVVVGYDSTCIIFQDSYYGPNYKMIYNDFDSDWDYSGHWGLFVSPWNVKVSSDRNILLGEVFNVTATITYPWASPFPKNQYPASMANATITLPTGLVLVSGEAAEKTIGTSDLEAGDSANVTWTVQAVSVGNYTITVEADGKVTGSVPPIPPIYPEYSYKDRIGGTDKSIIVVIPLPVASMYPLSASIEVGKSVGFYSTVTGGIPPYSYQWYLNDNPVSGANSSSWVFRPATSGIYYVYLEVTDSKGNTAQSKTASIKVARPVGGYSVAIDGSAPTKPLTPYLALIAIIMTVLIVVKRKTHRSDCTSKNDKENF
jgi:parallel beta-helix repeat protein